MVGYVLNTVGTLTVLDFASEKEEIGKETHKDFRDGIYTMPVLLALKTPEGRDSILPLIRKNAVQGLSDPEIARMEAAVIRCGGVQATCEEIHRMNRRCCTVLNQVEDSPAVYLLRSLLKLLDCSL